MYLKKFMYVNWGNIPQLEFEFGPICLFSGGNGSGKTTAADAIQTVMTAAHDHLFHFNPGQDEATQRGRGKQVRTLASYVLGCDDGSYARPNGCDGYLAAVFHPTQGEDSEPFTAIIAMRAHIDGAGEKSVARLDDLQFYILPSEQLHLSHFVKDDTGGRYVVPTDRLFKLLKTEFGPNAVEKYDKKKSYLCRLYGALRGRSEAVNEREAMTAARAFSRFMAYKPVRSINDFVATEILEPRDLGEAIRSVSSLLKTIHGMEQESRHLRESIHTLSNADGVAKSYIHQWLDFTVLRYTQAKAHSLVDQKKYIDAKREQKQLRDSLANNQKERGVAEQRRRQCREQAREMEAKRLGIPALRSKDELEQKIQDAHNQLHQLVPVLLQQDQVRQNNIEAAKELLSALESTSIELTVPGLNDKSLHKACSAVQQSADAVDLDLHHLLAKDWVDITPLESKLDDTLLLQQTHNRWHSLLFEANGEAGADNSSSVRDQLRAEGQRVKGEEAALQRAIERKQQDIHTLRGRRSSYPSFVNVALEAIHRKLPEADARVLCDYVEVLDGAWQSAIEGYIGGARFGIIVAPECEAEAIAIVRGLPGRDSRARVIQGSKARRDAEKIHLPTHSIIELMEFDHATARDYLIASYGNVEQVSDTQTLRNTRRGLTRDCIGSGNYAMFRCDMDDSELVFGKLGRERALLAKESEVTSLENQWAELQRQSQWCAEMLSLVDRCAPLTVFDTLQEMLRLHRSATAAETGLDQLDITDFTQLDDALAELHQQEESYLSTLGQLQKQAGEIEARTKVLDKQCKILADAQEQSVDEAELAEQGVRAIAADWGEFDVEQRLNEADDTAANTNLAVLVNSFTQLQTELSGAAHQLVKAVMAHNQICRPSDALNFEPDFGVEHGVNFFRQIVHLQRQLDSIHNRLKNNVLAEKHTQLGTLKDSFNNTFVTNLCHSIYQSINDGKKTLEDLNRELEHHRFGADRESFRFGWEWIPEYKEYWQFFKEVIDSPALADGNTLFEMKLTKKASAVRERMMSMLLDDDENAALRELERVADYRNYRNYEIYKEPESKAPIALSQYGTGSGGQLETPAYIIRSAAITSAFRFNEGKSHLRMVLVDEAFSKMDEHRSREVIHYLTESLGLQLMFIMPTSKSGPFMDLISNQFVFTKCPINGTIGQLNTRVLVDRQVCNRERIKELWAQHRRTIRHQGALDFMAEFEA
ncbi:ATP-binding protein [Marinibactrum halimedae]|uniref:AAA family ATPase n=1 Tax=Marinibactrum halimedae TaxID=1444977 RepID=A0AA37TBX3_9GAMM|nr:SbcC/MukB-like Walker B domain-containing protein [Marinibactrum halimedae]MCD9460574.1 hypothetical protein [Marinibactrum halimedae]GLS27205.1 hypothetical protein GCM10007877_29240 [Marinibactrum halimedae]